MFRSLQLRDERLLIRNNPLGFGCAAPGQNKFGPFFGMEPIANDQTSALLAACDRYVTTDVVVAILIVLQSADHSMTESGVSRFNCPTCGALYKVVQVEAEPATTYPEISCRRCDGPLCGRSGGFLLKYFFVDRPRRTDARVALVAQLS